RNVAGLLGGRAGRRREAPGAEHAEGQTGAEGEARGPLHRLLGTLRAVVPDQDPAVELHRLTHVVHADLLAATVWPSIVAFRAARTVTLLLSVPAREDR